MMIGDEISQRVGGVDQPMLDGSLADPSSLPRCYARLSVSVSVSVPVSVSVWAPSLF